RHLFGLDRWALGARAVDDPGENDDLIIRRLHRAGERRELAVGDVIADALDIGGRAMFLPDFPGFARQRFVCFELLLRHGDDETIDISHGSLLSFGTAMEGCESGDSLLRNEVRPGLFVSRRRTGREG